MKNLAKIRKLKNKSQTDVAKYCGVKPPTVSLWESGKATPAVDTAIKVAEFLDVPIYELLDIEIPQPTKIPLYNVEACCGNGNYIFDDAGLVANYLPAFDDSIDNSYFAVRVQGNSMSPRINDGDVIIVQKKEYCTVNINDVILIAYCGDIFVRYISACSPTGFTLSAINPSYPPIQVDTEIADYKIWGKVSYIYQFPIPIKSINQ